jgi:hypothetical protein
VRELGDEFEILLRFDGQYTGRGAISMTTTRERKAKRSLKLLGENRFMAFIRGLSKDKECLAVKLAQEELDAGHGLDDIFYTKSEYGFELSVNYLETDRFKIEFGCIAGPDAGDGGEWIVQFDSDGQVVSITDGIVWTA